MKENVRLNSDARREKASEFPWLMIAEISFPLSICHFKNQILPELPQCKFEAQKITLEVVSLFKIRWVGWKLFGFDSINTFSPVFSIFSVNQYTCIFSREIPKKSLNTRSGEKQEILCWLDYLNYLIEFFMLSRTKFIY